VHSSRRGARDIEHVGSADDEVELEALKAAVRTNLAKLGRLPRRWHYPADREGIEIWRRATRFDDSAARREFGIDPVPFPQTIADTVGWLVESGRVPARRASALKTA
jgi:hypothetical protein